MIDRSRRTAYLIPLLLTLLSACSDKTPSAPAAPPSASTESKSAEASSPPVSEGGTATAAIKPKAVQARRIATRSFHCAMGGVLTLDDYDDGTTRVVINGVTHALRPVNVDGGALLQGDNISVRVIGDQTTASQNGVVLNAGCQRDGSSG